MPSTLCRLPLYLLFWVMVVFDHFILFIFGKLYLISITLVSFVQTNCVTVLRICQQGSVHVKKNSEILYTQCALIITNKISSRVQKIIKISALNLKIAEQNRDPSTSKKEGDPRGKDKKGKKKKSKSRKRRNSSSSSSSDSSDSSDSSSGSDSDSSDSTSSTGKKGRQVRQVWRCVLTEFLFFWNLLANFAFIKKIL